MSIPKYIGYQLTMECLTDDVVDTALERCDYETLTTETARQALYDYMSFSSVSDEHMRPFLAELEDDSTYHDDGIGGLGYLERLADETDNILEGEEAVKYRDENIKDSEVVAAMKAVGVNASSDDMATLVANYVVCGMKELKNPDGCGLLLEQTGISTEQVVAVTNILIEN